MSSTVVSKLVCPECGEIFPIMRKKSKQKEQFHRKWLYCLTCQDVTNHIEIKNFDNWMTAIELKGEDTLKQEEQEVYQLVKKRGR